MRRWVYAFTCTSPKRYPRLTSAPCRMRAYASVLAHAYVVFYGAAAVRLGRSRPHAPFAPVATSYVYGRLNRSMRMAHTRSANSC